MWHWDRGDWAYVPDDYPEPLVIPENIELGEN